MDDDVMDIQIDLLRQEVEPHMRAIQDAVRRYAKPGHLEQITVIVADARVFEQVLTWHTGDSAALYRMLDQARHADEYSR